MSKTVEQSLRGTIAGYRKLADEARAGTNAHDLPCYLRDIERHEWVLALALSAGRGDEPAPANGHWGPWIAETEEQVRLASGTSREDQP